MANVPRNRTLLPVDRPWARAVTVLVAVAMLTAVVSGSAPADSALPAGYTVLASTPTQTDVTPNGPLTGLENGTAVTITVTGTPIFGVEARQCKPGLDIAFNAEFVPDGGYCIAAPYNAQSDSLVVDSAAPENTVSTLTFRVGTGSQTFFAPDFGENVTITCGPDAPCSLWLKLAVPATINNGNLFIHYDLTFAGAPPTTVTTVPPTTVTTVPPTTVTTVPPTTVTTVPPTTVTTVPPTTVTTVPPTTTVAPTTTTTVVSDGLVCALLRRLARLPGIGFVFRFFLPIFGCRPGVG